jgi:hypothetical protein
MLESLIEMSESDDESSIKKSETKSIKSNRISYEIMRKNSGFEPVKIPSRKGSKRKPSIQIIKTEEKSV